MKSLGWEKERGGGEVMLSVEERDAYMEQLNPEQKKFLLTQLTRSRRTVFANLMAKQKGYHIPENSTPETIEQLLQEWVYVGFIDAGKVTSELRCECGRSLRYQHHVRHKTSGDTLKLGIEHLKEHLGIDSSIVAAVIKGFNAIDYELDEVLLKYQNGWKPAADLLDAFELSSDVMEHLKLGLPLLERQLRKLRDIKRERVIILQQSSIQERDNKPAIDADLFSWNDTSASIDFQFGEAIQGYIKNGVKSARVLCELLIREHSASHERFSTGKPKLYTEVCFYIEECYPNALIKQNGAEDRLYTGI